MLAKSKSKKRKKPHPAVVMGEKRFCPGCGVKFYDFGNPDSSCPKCSKPIDLKARAPQTVFKRDPPEDEQPDVGDDAEDADDFELNDDDLDDEIIEEIEDDDDGEDDSEEDGEEEEYQNETRH